MNQIPPHQPDEDVVDEWLAQLRASQFATPTDENEKDRILYQSIIRHHHRQETELLRDAPTDDQAWQQMRDRLKKEGLLQPKPQWKIWMPMSLVAALLSIVRLPSLMWQQVMGRWLHTEGLLRVGNQWKIWVTMTVSVLVTIVLSSMLTSGIVVLDTAPASFRGSGQIFKVHDPIRVATTIAKDLKTLDSTLKLHWFGGVATIDTELNANQLNQAESLVRNKLPQDREIRLSPGFNRLEFYSKP